MSADQNDLLIRLAALEKENAALRGQASPQEQPSPPEESRSKLDGLLADLVEKAEALSLPNDPSIDPIVQTAKRTQALCKVVVSLIKAVGSGFGATGAVLGEMSRNLAAVRSFVEGGNTASVAGESQAVEVDNTGAPEAPEVSQQARPTTVKKKATSNGQLPARVAASPVGSPIGPPVAAPAGMPAEVAQLPQAPSAPIASVTVK